MAEESGYWESTPCRYLTNLRRGYIPRSDSNGRNAGTMEGWICAFTAYGMDSSTQDQDWSYHFLEE